MNNYNKVKNKINAPLVLKSIDSPMKEIFRTPTISVSEDKTFLRKAHTPLSFNSMTPKSPTNITSGERIHYTKEGFIDTRYFGWETPEWALDFNKQRDITISREYAKYPKGNLQKFADFVLRFSAYETMADVIVEPEKYKGNLFAILKRYVQELTDPQIDYRLKGFYKTFVKYTTGRIPPAHVDEEAIKRTEKRYRERIAKGEAPIGIWQYDTIWKGVSQNEKKAFCEAINQQYKIQGKDKVVKPEDLNEKNTIDYAKGLGLFMDLFIDPGNIVFMGAGKLLGKVMKPTGAMLKQAAMKGTVGKAAISIYRKTYASKTILDMGDEGVKLFNRIKVRSIDVAEAETKFLNITKHGWRGLVGKMLGTEVPEKVIRVPSIAEQIIEQITKRPTGQKAIEYFGKKFARGYGDTLIKDFTSSVKALNIKKGSWEELMVETVLRSKRPEDYAKYLPGLTDEMAEAVVLSKQLNKNIREIENLIGTAYDIDYVQSYLYRIYIEKPGKPQAYNIGREIGLDKPIVAYNRTFATKAEARAAGYIMSDGFIEPMIQRLKIHGDIMGRQGYIQALKETYGTKFIRDTRAATSEVYKELWDQGKRKVYGVKELREYMFDDKLAKILEKQVRPISNFEKHLLSWNKNVMGPIKKVWTFTTGFHIRNLFGSHYQNAMEYGVDSVFNAKKQEQAARLAWTSDEFGVEIGGQMYKSSAIRELFDMSGIGAGWYRGDIGMGGQRTVLGKALGNAWDKTMGFAGDMTERQVRMFSLVEGLNQSGNYIDALLLTKMLHFDYLDGLTRAERIYGRAIWPFYTWKRFNAPLQVYFMGTKTNRVASIFKTQRAIGIGDPAKIPLWFNRYIMGKIGTKDLNTNVQKYLKLDIPLAQISLFTPSYEAMTKDKHLSINERWLKFLSPFVAESNPVLKIIIEAGSRYDTFRTKETWQFPVRCPLPDPVIESLPDYFKNLFEIERNKDGYLVMNPEWAKVFENIPGLYQLSVMVGHERYPEYKKQKWLYDQLSMIGGVKIFPVDEEYYEKITEKEMDRMKTRKEEYKVKMERIKEFRLEEKEGKKIPFSKKHKPLVFGD